MKILVIHGPNLNMLGVREPDKYGNSTLEDINRELEVLSDKLGIDIECFQSNHEGDIIDKIHLALSECKGIIINPGAYTHTSVAIRDAIAAVSLPCVEVHLSNVYAREEFRTKSLIAPVCIGQIAGFKGNSYLLALRAIVDYLE